MHGFRIGPRHRAIAYALVIAMVLALVPEFKITLPVHAAEFGGDPDKPIAVYIDSRYDGQTIYIKHGVFSVTVNGATDVNLIFGERTASGAVGVTIDRRHATSPTADRDELDGKTVENLYEVSEVLGEPGIAQTCPLLITGNSTVTATFHGQCRFYAGTNACTVNNRTNVYTAATGGNGFAGIQVDSGSTLTIAGADDLMVFGGHQFGIPTIDSDGDGKADSLMYSHNNGTRQFVYSDILRAHQTITVNINGQNTTIYTNPSTIGDYDAPSHATHHNYSGGAGIGGGPTLDNTSTGQAGFTNGAPGNIIINGGNIEAFGGHQAAGIGGAVNSAATTGMIQINGGKVIAHGGRWAAGIGDGDSVTDPNISSTFETATSLIEINGGMVEAYGGVASSGIGTTDEISDDAGIDPDFERKMQINLNGGVIRAYSGFPKTFSGGNYPDEAPAAIGAGSLTMTPANSLHVAADADLRCAGFGNYALTENGQEANAVPNISVDSDGYLLLLRTGVDDNDSYHSTATRTLTLYTPVTVPFLGEEEEWTVYVDQNNKTALTRYLVSPSGTVYVEDKTGGSESAFGTKWSVAEGKIPTTLTLYINDKNSPHFDENFPESTVLETIEMAYFFRSIALTLPHPDEYGGLYALGVPMDGVRNSNLPSSSFFDQIALTVEAKNQGTQSGWIDFPSGSNMGKDNTAAPLTRLDVDDSADNLGPGTPGMIGDSFKSGVYAYTVYVEPGTTNVDLYLTFDQKKNDNGTNIHHKIELDSTTDSDDKVLRNNTNGATEFLVENLTLSGGETVLRIKKTDANNPLGTISYKVTIIVKGDYELTISAPDKIYDGRPADVSATGVVNTYPGYEAVDHPAATLPSDDTVTAEAKTYPFEGTAYITTRTNGTKYAANLSYQVRVIPDGTNLYYILTFDARSAPNGTSIQGDRNNSYSTKYAVGWSLNRSNGEISLLPSRPSAFNVTGYTWRNTNVTLAQGRRSSNYDTSLILEVTATGANLYVSSNTNNKQALLTLPATTSQSDGDLVSTKATALAKANIAIKSGATSGSYSYESYNSTLSSQLIEVGTFSWSGGNSTATTRTSETVEYPLSGTKHYTEFGEYVITPTEISESVKVPAEDLENVVYTYYRTHDAAGNKLGAPEPLGVLAEPPKDAGTYRVEASLVMLTYNANGQATFVINQRPVTVLRIANWLVYVDTAPTTATLTIPDPGYIELDNLIQGDDVKLVVDAAGGKVYYDDPGSDTLAVDYKSDKIVLAQATLGGNQAHNYKLVYTDESDPDYKIIRVYGQIAYEVNGTIFRKDEGAEADWRKYYPVDSEDPVGGGTAPDYHSPAESNTEHGTYLTHAEYIRARTVNQGEDEARYCIDIEYGAMSFGFFRSIWDVNDLDYDETDTSRWTGMDGSNNKLTIVNYSNRPVEYTLSLTRDAQFGGRIDFAIKTANVTTGGDPLVSMTGTAMSAESGKHAVAAATAGSGVGASGEEARTSSYVILSGVPQFAEGITPSVGTIGISFSPASGGS